MSQRKRSSVFWGLLVSITTLLVTLLGFLSDAFSLWDRFFLSKEPIKTPPPIIIDDAIDVLNLKQGNWWSYSYGELAETSVSNQELELSMGSFKEIVISDVPLSENIRVLGIDIQGVAYALRCDASGLEEEADYWFITDGNRVYLACDEQKINSLANLFFQGHTDSNYAPHYIFPLVVGASWAGFDGESVQADGLFSWNVHAQENISVPAGVFSDCYKLVLPTGSDRIERWVCPGVGVVAENYIHSGQYQTIRNELIVWGKD